MPEWPREKIANCLDRADGTGAPSVQARAYKASGLYPIVDQGKGLIAGWTDDATGLISGNPPLVVFGDHTRAFKYVDFPFVRGADGTQILKPKEGIDPLFFYYACQTVDLPNRGYNRHFRALKDKEVPLPSIEEQLGIARGLRLLEKAIAIQTDEVRSSEALKRTAMGALFTRGLRGEAQKETEIGPAPSGWKSEPLGARYSVVSGGTPSRANPAFWKSGAIPWVRTTEVDYCMIRDTGEHITQAGLDGSAAKLLPAGTLLLAMYGQGITRGKVAVLGIPAACNQACAAIRSTDNAVDNSYLYHFMTYRYEAIRQLAHGGQQQNLNLDIVREIPIVFPPGRKEQLEIVAVLDAIDRKIDLHRRKRAVLEELFKTLLHKLMTGEIRVTDLDLSALSPNASEPAAA